MPNNRNILSQVTRLLHILKLIPRSPRWITISQIVHELNENKGFKVTKRTIQRDMHDLYWVYPHISLDQLSDTRENCFYWAEDAPMENFSGLTINQALSLSLMEKYLAPLFPAVTLEELNPFFEQADATLDCIADNPIAQWPEKIAVVPPTQPLLPPEIKPNVHRDVSSALMNEKQLKFLYRKANGDENNYCVNPLGLVLCDAVTYLAASKSDTGEVRTFALHRILSTKQTDENSIRPPNFTLGDFINQGQLEFNFSGASYIPIKLVAIFDDLAIKHLYETRLSEDQVIENLGNNQNKITATVRETEQLFWWLQSFGSRVEVLEPVALRNKMAESVKVLAAKYAV